MYPNCHRSQFVNSLKTAQHSFVSVVVFVVGHLWMSDSGMHLIGTEVVRVGTHMHNKTMKNTDSIACLSKNIFVHFHSAHRVLYCKSKTNISLICLSIFFLLFLFFTLFVSHNFFIIYFSFPFRLLVIPIWTIAHKFLLSPLFQIIIFSVVCVFSVHTSPT